MRFLLSLCCLAFFASDAATIAVIANGRTTANAYYNPAGWQKSSGGMIGSGAGNPIFCDKMFDTASFEVKAVLSFAAWSNSAPRFTIGDVNCGFDGGGKDHVFFTETCLAPAQVLDKGVAHITPKKDFSVLIKGKDGILSYFINGKKLGEHKYSTAKPLSFSINPWRATLTLKSFSISGKVVCDLADSMPVPVCRRLLRTNCNDEAALPLANLRPGKYKALLSGINSETEEIPFEMEIDEDMIGIFPKHALKKIYAAIGGKNHVRVALLQIPTGNNWVYKCRLVIHDPTAKAIPAEGKVVYRNGRGSFVINGVEMGSFSGSVGLDHGVQATQSITRFGNIGINSVLFIDNVWKFVDADGNLDKKRYAKDIIANMTALTGRNPNANFKIYYHLYMPPAWCKKHPQELIRLDNGVQTLAMTPEKSLQPSCASELWRKQMGNIITESIEILQNSPFADRVPYFRVCYGNCGEWNNFGYAEQAYVDISKPMQNAFRKYLQKKYKTDAALQKAWNTPGITFASDDLVPTREHRWKGGNFVRANGADGMRSVDYYEFWQKYSAETVIHFAKIVKKASKGKMLTGAYFGYYFGHYGLNPFHFQDCGQYGVPYLLAAPEIDFFGGPYPYNQRLKSMIVNGVTGSIRLAQKMWESENDERTHHSGTRNLINGTTANLSESLAVGKRNIMMNFTAGSCFYYYDFIGDWYRDAEYMAMVKRMKEIDHGLRAKEWNNPARLAIIVSEKTIPYFTSKNENKIIRQLNNFFNKELPFIGIPYDVYYTTDLDKIDFKQYTAVLFPNSTFADGKFISDVHKYAAGEGRKLIFFHSPGLINIKNKFDTPQSEKLTGIKIAFDPKKRVGTVSGKYGKTKLAPVLFRTVIADANATVLGTWEDGSAAIAEKQFPDWKSIVICHHAPDIGMLRNLLKDNGVKFWSSGRAGLNQCSFAGPLLSMYSRSAGQQTFWLPEKVEIAVDLFTGEVLGRNTAVINFSSPAQPHTRVIFAGKSADYKQYFERVKK